MADPRFFTNTGALPLAVIAGKIGAEIRLAGGVSYDVTSVLVHDVAPLSLADSNSISFFDNKKYLDEFKTSKAGFCITQPKYAGVAPVGMTLLVTDSPYAAYATLAQLFYPESLKSGLDVAGAVADSRFQGAAIHPSVTIGQNVRISHGAVIGANVQISDSVYIGANVVIGKGVVIGENTCIDGNTTISHALIGQGVRIYAGAQIGQDGFGFAPTKTGFFTVPQLGRVILEDGVFVGSNTTIDRGAGPDTVIGQGARIDNMVQIAHNVRLGKGCIVVAQVGIAGSTIIGDYVQIGGQTGIAGHVKIGNRVQIAANSGVFRDIADGEVVSGVPAVGFKQHMRQIAVLQKMAERPENSKRIAS